MRFQVPQFIEVESKIFGPLTLKQFIYLAGGAGIIFLLYISLPLFLTFLIALPVGAFSLALAFYKVNNQPFIKVVENFLGYTSKPKLYLWKKKEPGTAPKPLLGKEGKGKGGKQTEPQIQVPQLTKNKLKDLAWSLDIKEKIK